MGSLKSFFILDPGGVITLQNTDMENENAKALAPPSYTAAVGMSDKAAEAQGTGGEAGGWVQPHQQSPPTGPQPGPQGGNTVIQMQTVFGTEPVSTVCSNCYKQIVTTVDKSFSTTGWLCCCFVIGIWSLCFDSSYHFTHNCPSCKAILGKHRPEISKGMVGCAVACVVIGFICVILRAMIAL